MLIEGDPAQPPLIFFFAGIFGGLKFKKKKKNIHKFFSQAWLPESDLPWSLWFWFQEV